MDQIALFEELLSRRIPSPPNLPVTFLEIAQMPHYEVVISRIYQFYLQDLEEHGFKDLFLGALFSLVNHKWKTHASTERQFFAAQPARWEVDTEVVTKKGNRIDILIGWESEDQKRYIIIENKVFHILQNDLEDYFNTPQTLPENKTGVLLTLEKQSSNHRHFINITHEEWMGEVKKRLGEYMMTGVDRHLFFIRDFILNLSKLTKNTEYMSEFGQFYFEHRAAIEQLVEARNLYIQQVFSAYEAAGRQLNLETGGKRAGYYQYLIKEKGEVMFTLIFHNQQPHAFSIVYEIQGGKLPFKDELREEARILISSDRWRMLWVNTWGNASCAHIVGVSYPALGNDQQDDLVGFFVKEIKEVWLPFSEELERQLNI